MAALTVQTVLETGVVPTAQAVSASDTFANPDGDVIIEVTNGSGGTLTVGIAAAAGADLVVPGRGTMEKADGGGTLTNGQVKAFGPFPPAGFNNSSGNVTVTFSATTSVTCKVLKVPRI
jgi:hypothetical protein